MVLATSSVLLLIVCIGTTFAVLYQHKPPVKASTASHKSTTSTKAAVPKKSSTASTSAPVNKTPVTQNPTSIAQSAPTHTAPQQTTNYVGTLPSSIPVNVSGGNDYYYAGARQLVTASGASVTLTQAQPVVNQSAGTENHSVMELAVESSNGQQIVEIGWIVDQIMNNDSLPHLFVYHWTGGGSSCYNGCGFVPTGGVAPGSALPTNTTGTFSINYTSNAWYISYNGTTIGYFPESLWGGAYTQAGLISTFGEVEISPKSTTQCIQMGNGIAGASAGSAQISNFSLIGSASGPALSPYATTSSPYSYGSPSATGLHIGGPGIC